MWGFDMGWQYTIQCQEVRPDDGKRCVLCDGHDIRHRFELTQSEKKIQNIILVVCVLGLILTLGFCFI